MAHLRPTRRTAALALRAAAIGALLYAFNRVADVAMRALVLGDSSGLWSNYGNRLSVATVIWSCLLVPPVEEFLFRRLLFGLLIRVSPASVAALIASGVFSLVHTDDWGTPTMLTHWVFGLICQVLYIRTGGLTAPIACHAVANLLVLVPKPSIESLARPLGLDSQPYQLAALLIAGLAAGAALLWLLRSTSVRQRGLLPAEGSGHQ
ncbi:MAG: CPBP family intramembrane metalloprotease [Ideonella sp.]|nr:CPBP family intramembrane metalloprotease [Ideonella sp.]MCC7457345.1 CPBP family intramembrane metalloprotease [Nitrospira sp.]